MTPAPFTPRHARELTWFFGEGTSYVVPCGIDYEAKIEAVRTGDEPVYDTTDGDKLARFGRIDRALYGLTRPYDRLLSIAYGDAGEVATLRGLRPDLRWRCVGHLTTIAAERAPQWLATLADAAPCGDPRHAWAEDVYARVAAGAPHRVTEVHDELLRQAGGLLGEGESLFAGAYDRILGNERAIASAGRRAHMASLASLP